MGSIFVNWFSSAFEASAATSAHAASTLAPVAASSARDAAAKSSPKLWDAPSVLTHISRTRHPCRRIRSSPASAALVIAAHARFGTWAFAKAFKTSSWGASAWHASSAASTTAGGASASASRRARMGTGPVPARSAAATRSRYLALPDVHAASARKAAASPASRHSLSNR